MLERISIIVYYQSPKVLKHIKQFGHVAYYHKKRRYAVLYINAKDQEEIVKALQSYKHIRKVEVSQLDQSAYILDTEIKEEVVK